MHGSGAPKEIDVGGSQPSENKADGLAVNTQVIDLDFVALVLSDERQREYMDQMPSRFDCKVHVVLLVVIGNSWLWDKHWYGNI